MPQLEWAFLAEDATVDGGLLHVRGGLMHTVVSRLPSIGTVAVVLRVWFSDEDIGRQHDLVAEAYAPDGRPVGNASLQTAPILPQPDIHTSGRVPAIFTMGLTVGLLVEGPVRFVTTCDGVPLGDDLILSVRSDVG